MEGNSDSLKLREGFFQDFCVCFFKLIIFVYVLALCYEFFFLAQKVATKSFIEVSLWCFVFFFFFFLQVVCHSLRGRYQ